MTLIYLWGHTSKNSFENTSDWEPISNMTKVYSGNFTVTYDNQGWVTINLDKPFAYDNIHNLVIAIDDNSGEKNMNNANFYCSDVSENRTLKYTYDSRNPDPSDPPTAQNNYKYIPNTIIVFNYNDAHIPYVNVKAITDIAHDTAISGGNIITNGGAEIIESGLCWSMSENPTIDDNKTTDGTSFGEFTSTISGLEPNTKYYVRAYATNSQGTGYSELKEFTTKIEVGDNEVIDIDGNVYQTVVIGTQTWMAENLKVTKYNDGIDIPNLIDNSAWNKMSTNPGYSFYNNEASNADTYGALYNWWVIETEKLCPTGWHVPSYHEWQTLANYLSNNGFKYDGSIDNEKDKIGKSMASNQGWTYSNEIGSIGNSDYADYINKSGFNGVPSGNRSYDGSFALINETAYWWTSTDYASLGAHSRRLNYDTEYLGGTGITTDGPDKRRGFSIRCVMDYDSQLPIVTTNVVTDANINTSTTGGNITYEGASSIIASGVCWSTSEEPTIEGSKTTDGLGVGEFTSSITGLQPNTKYYVRAYATNSVGTAYGEQREFTTLAAPLGETVTDIDGNEYPIVVIGTQTWMAENLKVTKFNDGTAIPKLASTAAAWTNVINAAYTVYDYEQIDGLNSESEVIDAYGLLYSGYVVISDKNVCPEGWSVPGVDEWDKLKSFISNEGLDVGTALKSCRQVDAFSGGDCATDEHPRWNYYNDSYGTDNYGFNGLPGGCIDFRGPLNVENMARFWTTKISEFGLERRDLGYGSAILSTGNLSLDWGLSVRCVKNTESQAMKPTVTTTAISDIAQTSAKSGGNVTDDGGAEIIARGVCWSTSEEPTTSDSKTTDGTGIGEFSSSITGLQSDTKYYIRAYATNSEGTGYGEQREFTTKDENYVSDIIIIGDGNLEEKLPLNAFYNYSYSQSIYLQSEINRTGYITTVNYYYNGNSAWSDDLDIYMGHTSKSDFEGSSDWVSVDNMTKVFSGLFTVTKNEGWVSITLDTPFAYDNSSNLVIAVDDNSGTYHANADRFFCTATTENRSIDTYADLTNFNPQNPPSNYNSRKYIANIKLIFIDDYIATPTVVTTNISDITATSAKIAGNLTSDGGAEVTTRGVCWSTSEEPTIEGSKTTDGLGVGEFTSSITGLQPNTKYYVRAYATNSVGTAYGEQREFTTLAAPLGETVTDIDGNEYPIVVIGTQTWMAENLKVTKFNNGDEIPNVESDDDWGSTNFPVKWSYYNNDASNNEVYGKLYSGSVAVDDRNICPDGWHVASKEDWEQLIDYLGGASEAGDKLMDNSGSYWEIPNNATNESGFTAVPNGYRSGWGDFVNLQYYANFWTSTVKSTMSTHDCSIHYSGSIYMSDAMTSSNAKAIRCIKDNDSQAQTPTITTTAISDIAQTSAKSGGNVTDDGGAEIIARGVCWSTSEEPTTSDSKITDGTGIGAFTSTMIDLQANTKYYVRAYATNSEGTAYGEQREFTTLQAQSGVALQLPFYEDCEGDVSAWNIEDRDADGKKWKTSATLPHSGVHAFHVGFNSSGNNDWLISPELSFPDNQQITLTLWAVSEFGSFQESFDVYVIDSNDNEYLIESIKNVPKDYTEYIFDLSEYAGQNVKFAIVCVSVDKYYLHIDDISCVATGDIGESLPIVATMDVYFITSSSATIDGNVIADGGAEVTARGVCWSTSEEPTTSDSKTTDGTGVGEFTSTITDLQTNTKYYVRAYATNSKGTAYGEQKEFTTLDLQANVDFASGSGTESDPYIITTAEQLDNLRNYVGLAYSDTYFKLGNDIDLQMYLSEGNDGYNNGDYWKPIGDILTGFYGHLDGDDYSIINYKSKDNGLFGTLRDGASIRNLTIIGDESAAYSVESNSVDVGLLAANMTNNSVIENSVAIGTVKSTYSSGYTGGLVGSVSESSITNSHFIGDVEGTENVGGLIGFSTRSDITFVSSQGNIQGIEQVGGLIGKTFLGNVSNAFSTATVVGTGTGAGGLIGENSNTSITASYATGSVEGNEDVGGLIGTLLDAGIDNSYATGSVNGDKNVGGLIGYADAEFIKYSFSTGKITGLQNIGGLVGRVPSWNAGTVENSFWDTDASGIAESATGVGKTSIEMKQQNTFASWDSSIWDFADGKYPGLVNLPEVTIPGDDPEIEEAIGWINNGKDFDGRILKIHMPSASVVYGVGDHLFNFKYNPIVAKSTDGGITWEKLDFYIPQTEWNFNDVYFIDNNTGFIAAGKNYEGVIYKTTDGGENWSKILSTSYEIKSIQFIDATFGYATGISGKAWKTTDGGDSWSEIPISTTDYISNISFVNKNVGWVTGEDGNVFKTIDGGATWQAQDIKTTAFYFHDIHAVSDSEVYILTYFGAALYKTTDGGESWVKFTNLPISEVKNAFFVNAQKGWITNSTDIYVTNDGGSSWEKQSYEFLSEEDTVVSINKLHMYNDQIGVISYNKGFLRTTNGGVTKDIPIEPDPDVSIDHIANTMQIAPNPCKEYVSVFYADGIQNIEIYSIEGKKLIQHNVQGNQTVTIPTVQLLPGMYIIKIKTVSNTYFIEKLIKQE